MHPVQAAVLGLVQGLTEFLPISSSAHLILVSWLAGWPDQGLIFDMAAHAGSLAAVIFYFRADLARLVRGLANELAGGTADPEGARLARGLLWATAPVAVAGLVAQGGLEAGGRDAVVIATTSIGFGLALGWADWRARGGRTIDSLSWGTMMAIGVAQALALIPGVSRAGVTLTAALMAGMARHEAARFSFLLAVPVGILVAAKQLVDLAGAGGGPERWLAPAVGFLVAGLAAYLAIAWLLAWVRRQSLAIFVVYRVALGAAILVWAAVS